VTVDLLALGVSGVVLMAVLLAALAASPRVPPVLVAVPGAVGLVLVGAVGGPQAESALRDVAPTVAFLVVMLLLAHLADGEGLFTWAAAVTARSGRSARGLLGRVVVLAAVVTAVLSLDTTAVLLTPVVVATAVRLRVPVLPHAYAAGHLANSASLLLPVSNLTNLLAFAATGLTFLHFTGLMLAPWLVAVALEAVLLRWLFRADLRGRTATTAEPPPPPPTVALVVVGLVVLGFGATSFLDLDPVWPAAAGVAALAARQLWRGTTSVGRLVTAADVGFAGFVLGLSVIVLAVVDNGLGALLGAVLPSGTSLPALLGVAAVAAVLANLLNNLPATLALLPVAAVGGAAPVLAVLIGVNVGPNLSYVGSLANLLWRRALGREAPGAARYSVVGLLTVPLILVAATTALWLAVQV